MKQHPYGELINISIERKEYSLLCRGKSDKYTFYTDWEDHISELLLKFPSQKDLYNFKRFCLNASRATSRAPEVFWSYIILLLTFTVDQLFPNVSPWIVWAALFMMIAYSIFQNKIVIKESYFFTDIIEIIEKIEPTFE